MRIGRRIAFDVGEVRIGVAVTDAHALVCTPLSPLSAAAEGINKVITALISEYDPIYLVVGNPKHLSGADSPSSERSRHFVSILKNLSGIPVYLVDERLTTVTAGNRLKERGIGSRDSKHLIDSESAVLILESAVEAERRLGAPLGELL